MISERVIVDNGVCCTDIFLVVCTVYAGGLESFIIFHCGSGDEKYLPCQSCFIFQQPPGESLAVKGHANIY